jgi:hypothetical protein
MKLRIAIVFAALTAVPAHAKYNGHLVKGEWIESWNPVFEEALNSTVLLGHTERQIENLCRGYTANVAKRKMFWQQLMISLSWKESLHGPENWVEFRGGRNDGLYQINPVLRTAYNCTDFDLFDPLQNIRCALKMAEKLTLRFGTFLKGTKEGMAAYWQPLRATSKLNRKNRAFILGYVKDACDSGKLTYHSPATLAQAAQDVDRTFNEIDLDLLGLKPEELEPAIPGFFPAAPNF